MWTKKRGNVTELKCMAKMAELGFTVLMPYGDAERYDFVIEKSGKFFRIQSKPWAYTNTNGSICITTSSSHKTSYGTKKSFYTEDEIDFFSTIFNDNCYLIPVKLCACKNCVSFRVAHPLMNGRKCHMLSDYDARKVMAEYVENGIEKIYNDSESKKHAFPCKCIECGKEIHLGRKRCKKCNIKKRSKSNSVNRDEFEMDVRSHSYKYAMDKYKVSYPTIKKWIKDFGIGISKIEHSKAVAMEIKNSKMAKSKKIGQYDKFCNLIKVFDSPWNIKDELGFKTDRITRCCNGNRKTHGGFIWKYVDDNLLEA